MPKASEEQAAYLHVHVVVFASFKKMHTVTFHERMKTIQSLLALHTPMKKKKNCTLKNEGSYEQSSHAESRLYPLV